MENNTEQNPISHTNNQPIAPDQVPEQAASPINKTGIKQIAQFSPNGSNQTIQSKPKTNTGNGQLVTFSIIGVAIYLIIGSTINGYDTNPYPGPRMAIWAIGLLLFVLPLLLVLGIINTSIIRKYLKVYRPKGISFALAIIFIIPSILCILAPLLILLLNVLSLTM